MRIWKPRKEQVLALPFIVSMSPPGYPSAWLRPRRARFRFARQDHCSSTTSIRLNFRMPLDSGAISSVNCFSRLVISCGTYGRVSCCLPLLGRWGWGDRVDKKNRIVSFERSYHSRFVPGSQTPGFMRRVEPFM